MCPQWFHSAAEGGEGAGGITSSKFRADWAFRQRDFEVFPGGSHGPGICGDTDWGGPAVPGVLHQGERTLWTASLAAVPQLIPLLVRAERVAAPGRAGLRPDRGGDLRFATIHPGVSLEQSGQEGGAAPELIPGRRAHGGSSAAGRAGVCGRDSRGRSLACGFLSAWG